MLGDRPLGLPDTFQIRCFETFFAQSWCLIRVVVRLSKRVAPVN